MLAAVILIAALVAAAAIIIFHYRKKLPEVLISYKVVPPAYGEGPKDAKSFYRHLHALCRSASAKIVIEISSSPKEGIFYLVSAPISVSHLIREYLIAYWPMLEITRIRSGSCFSYDSKLVYSVRQWGVSQAMESDNPLSYLFGSMRGLKANEIMAWQVILESEKDDMFESALKLAARISRSLFRTAYQLLLVGLADPDKSKQLLLNWAVKKPAIKQRQFKVCFRSLAAAGSNERLERLESSFEAAIKSYGFRRRPGIDAPQLFMSRESLGYTRAGIDLLSRMFYFPSPVNSISEDVETSKSTSLPAPTALKSRAKNSLVLGLNNHNGKITPIGFTAKERPQHMMVIGGTGMGKSNLLCNMITQDVLTGNGAGLIDPHGDLASRVAGYIPASRLKDVIYIDPSDIHHPVSINLMELPEHLRKDELEIAKDFVTESIVSIFRKIFSDDDSGGHRIEYILRNTIHTAFSVPGATLFTLHKLLTNDLFRAGIVASLSDDSLKDFWYGEFNKAGSYQRVKMIAGVTAKLGRFQRSVVAKRMLEQPASSISFDQLLARKEILICNFSKGVIGEDTSSLLGMIVMSKLQLAAWKRSLIAENKRYPFYLYVDEFQEFQTSTFSQMVSDSRKYGMYLTISEQTTAHQTDQEAAVLLANMGSVLSFKSVASIDYKRIGSLFSPYLSATDFANLKPYHFYLRRSGEAGAEPLSGLADKIKKSPSKLNQKKIDKMKEKYTYPYTELPLHTAVGRVPVKK